MNYKNFDDTICINCGKLIGKGWKFKNRKYCNNKCQGEFRKKENLKYWLLTGKLKNLTIGGNTTKAGYVREYIFKDQQGKCAICKIEDKWNEKPLKFLLDHIDGNATDNSRKNLRLICHNCDSQTDTYKNRNIGKGRGSRKKQK